MVIIATINPYTLPEYRSKIKDTLDFVKQVGANIFDPWPIESHALYRSAMVLQSQSLNNQLPNSGRSCLT